MSNTDVQLTSSTVTTPRENHIRARQRRQTLIFLSTVCVVLLIGLIALGNWLQWWNFGGTHAAVACPVQTVTDPALTAVNVYNGTTRTGLAAAVAKELRHRRFAVATIDNEVEARPIKAVAHIRYGASGALAAHTVALEFPGKVKLVKIKRTDASVDVVLGQNYKTMVERSKAAAATALKPDPAGCTITATPSASAS